MSVYRVYITSRHAKTISKLKSILLESHCGGHLTFNIWSENYLVTRFAETLWVSPCFSPATWENMHTTLRVHAFVRLTVGRNSILNFPAKIWAGMRRVLLCGDDLSHSQSQFTKRLLLAYRGHPIRSPPQGWLLLTQGSQLTPWTRPQLPPGPTTSLRSSY